MNEEINRLLRLRREYPITGYIAISGMTISLVLAVLLASDGVYIPIIVGVILVVFLSFLLLMFSKIISEDSKGFYYWLAIFTMIFVALIFMVWIVSLTLAVFCIVSIPILTMNCITPVVNVTGSMQPQYILRHTTSERGKLDNYRSSCEGSSSDIFRVCLPEGYTATNASILNPWLKNDNGKIGAPYRDPNSDRCFQVEWSAGSGGRTGVFECRYHGHIKLELDVVGYRDSNVIGDRESFEGTMRNGDSFRYAYSLPLPSSPTEIMWNYAAEVNFPRRFFSKSWVAHLSDANPIDECVSSEIVASAVRLRTDC